MKKFSGLVLRYLLLPVFFLGLGIFLLFTQKSDFGVFSIVVYEELKPNSKEQFNFIDGQILSHSFELPRGGLGLVGVRFDNNFRINPGQVEFRIKNQANNDWIYKQKYNVDQFLPNEFFSFGFPPQFKEGDKVYFEIESIDGDLKDYVSLSNKQPQISYGYSLEKRSVLGSLPDLVNFLFSKMYFMLGNMENIKSGLLFLQPLLIYLVVIVFLRHQVSVFVATSVDSVRENFSVGNFRRYFILFLLTYVNSFLIEKFSFLVLVISLFGIYFIKRLMKIGGSDFFLLTFYCLLFIPFLIFFDITLMAQNIAIFCFIYLAWASIESIFVSERV